jgi:anaerobic magnesium-protoporphyrin IX monomethyl ester cyclase
MSDQTELYDILIVVPHYGAKDGFIWKAIEYRFYTPGVLSIAAFLRKHNFKVKVFDCNLEQITEKLFIKEFKNRFANCKFRYIGFSSATQTINQAYRLSEVIKGICPKTKIIFGGAHATALPEDVLTYKHIDFVVIGEGEITSLEILQDVNPEYINGLAYSKSDEIIINPPRERIKNVDDLPIAAYDLVPIQLSKPLIGTYKKLPATIMVTARGCPGNCTFCSRVLGNKLCAMSPERIIREIEVLYYKYKFRQIIFYDDTFISNRRRISEFCDLLIASGMKISWTCSSRVDRVYPDLLRKMKMAGCHQIMYGVESFDNEVLNNINKSITRDDIIFAIKETKKAGIEARAAIMIGNKGDTESILKNNILELKKLNPDLIQATITTALPGSQLFAKAMQENRILTYNWDKYEGSDQITKHETLSFKTLQKYYRKTYLQFYLRPLFLIRTLFKTNSIFKIKILFIGLISIIPILFRTGTRRDVK